MDIHGEHSESWSVLIGPQRNGLSRRRNDPVILIIDTSACSISFAASLFRGYGYSVRLIGSRWEALHRFPYTFVSR